MGEDVHAAAELTGEGLSVGERDAAHRRTPDVGDN